MRCVLVLWDLSTGAAGCVAHACRNRGRSCHRAGQPQSDRSRFVGDRCDSGYVRHRFAAAGRRNLGRHVIEAAVKVLPPSGADRAIAVPSEGGYFVAVADGAGGTGGGASAADRLIVVLTRLTAQALRRTGGRCSWSWTRSWPDAAVRQPLSWPSWTASGSAAGALATRRCGLSRRRGGDD